MRALALTLVLLAAAAPTQQTAQKPAQQSTQKPRSSDQRRNIVFGNISRQAVDFLLKPVPQPDALRLAQLKQSFSDMECHDSLRELPVGESKNLICTLPGTAPELVPGPAGKRVPNPSHGTILFLAHYEHVGPGQSAIDNWSGAVMLPCLYLALAPATRNHTFLFAEVDGEAGAKTLFDSFTPAERHAIKAVVVLDALGLGPAQFYLSPDDITANSSSGWAFLHRQLLQAAADQRMAAPAPAIPGGWQKIDETREFRHRSIPSILIHSVTKTTRDIPGSSRDTVSAIDHDVYFSTLTLLSYYGAELDQPWPQDSDTTLTTPGGRRH